MGGRWSSDKPVAQVPHHDNGFRVILSGKQKAVIKETWKVVSRDMKGFGVGFFLKFFRANDGYKDFFPAFREECIDSLEESIVLRAHGMLVMHAVMTSFDLIEQPDKLNKHLCRIVTTHYNSGIRVKQFRDMFALLVDTLAEHNDIIFEEFHYTTWHLVFAVLLQCITDIMENIETHFIT